MSLYRRQFK